MLKDSYDVWRGSSPKRVIRRYRSGAVPVLYHKTKQDLGLGDEGCLLLYAETDRVVIS
jgi:hypothetical protein